MIKWPTHQSMVDSSFRYNESDHERFLNHGFVHFSPFLTSEATDFLKKQFDAVQSELPNGVHPEWVLALHQFLPERNNWMWCLATEPKLLDLVERHLGPNLVLYSTQLADKPPMGGRRVPWHQDGERCRTVWIPLDDVDHANGGLRVKPGWHKKGRMKYRHVATEEEYDDAVFNMRYSVFEIDPRMELEKFEEGAHSYALPGGSLEIHDPCLPHASEPNSTTDRHRRVIILRYQPTTEPIVQNPIINPLTGLTELKCNYLVRGVLGDQKAVTKSRAKCLIERISSLRYDMRRTRTRESITQNGVSGGRIRDWMTR